MTQGHDFIYCLVDRPDAHPLFWSIGANGKAKLSAKPALLEFSPDGWLDIAIQNVKNRLYWGVDRSVSIPFGYIEDGATILKTIMYKYGPEKPVYLKICRQMLDYEPNPHGVLEFTAGQSPFTPNGTATGTITGTPGATVYVRFDWNLPVNGDTLTGNFDAQNFIIDYQSSPPTFMLTIPAGGVINFSILYTQVGGSTGNAGMYLVNAQGNTVGSWGFWYKQIYVGQVNMPDMIHDGAKVTVSTLEDGLPKFLKANENTTIELAMDVPEAVFYKDDGIILHNRATFFLGNGQLVSSAQSHVVDLRVINKEFEAVGDVHDAVRTVAGDNNALNASGQNFFKASVDCTLTIEYDFILNVEYVPPPGINPAAIVYVQISHMDLGGVINSAETLLQRSVVQGIPGSYHLQGTINVNVLKDQRLFLWTRCNVLGASGDSNMLFDYSGEGIWRVSYESRFATTYTRALRPQYILQKLLDFVTDNTYDAFDGDGISNYFGTSNHYDKPFTCGNAIRGFDDAMMKISFSTFFNFWNCFDAVGIVARNDFKVVFDRKKNLTNFNSSISLGGVSKLKTSLDKSFAFNELEIGDPEIKNEGGLLNGNDAFCCKYLWSLGTTLSPAKLNKVPTVKTNCYEMELTRITTANRASTDYKNDNELYAVHIENTLIPAAGDIPAHYLLNRQLNQYATGLTEPVTVYNMIFSPKRRLENMGDYLRSSLMLQDWKTLGYQNADKNNKLITTIPGSPALVTEEKRNVNIGSLAPKFFVPMIIEFTCIAPFDLLELLDIDPLQLFDFDFYGVNYRGILLRAGLAPGSEREQVYQLLSTADNDLETLIEYNG